MTRDRLIFFGRISLGIVFVISGLNYFFEFFFSPVVPAAARPLFLGLDQSGYFFPILSTIYVVCGIFLTIGLYVPLMLVIFAPIIINIVAVHFFLAPQGLPFANILMVLECYLAYQYRGYYQQMMTRNAAPR